MAPARDYRYRTPKSFLFIANQERLLTYKLPWFSKLRIYFDRHSMYLTRQALLLSSSLLIHTPRKVQRTRKKKKKKMKVQY